MTAATARAIRCKVRVGEVLRRMNAEGDVISEEVTLQAVASSDPDSDNFKWSKATPSAQFKITISNPAAMGALTSGHEFYVDFTPA